MDEPQLLTDAQVILEHFSDAFFSLTRDWRFAYLNHRAEELLNRKKEELLGKSIWEEFPEAVHRSFYAEYHRAMEQRTDVQFIEYYPAPLDRWYDVRAYPSQQGIYVYFRDITEKHKQARSLDQQYRSLFDRHPDAVFSFDLKGHFLSLNAATERLTGYSKEELLSMTFVPFMHPDSLELTMTHFQLAARGIPQVYENRIIHKDGYIVDCHVTNIPLEVDNSILGVFGIAKDISKQKETEKLLLKAEKLNIAGQLAAAVAHEIRNPLTALKGFVQLLGGTNVDPKRAYIFPILQDEISRIESITSELLLLAKPQAVESEPLQLGAVLQSVTALIGSQANMSGVEIDLRCEHTESVIGEENRLKQVFVNIVKNAIEVMPDGGCVTIEVGQLGAEVFVRVTDQGHGIKPEHMERIGEPFYSTKEKGTGLGLMVTKKIIGDHAGRLEIDSRLGVGTVVTVFLPVYREIPNEPQ